MAQFRSLQLMKCATKLLCRREGCREIATQTAAVPLVRTAPVSRSDWERSRRNTEEPYSHTGDFEAESRRVIFRNQKGFGRPHTHKTKIGTNFIAKLQSVSSNTPKEELRLLLMKISQHIDEFNEYELVDIGYYLTRVNSEDCASVVEPILHRFFSLPERHSCLNGVYIHRWVGRYELSQNARLLRTMFIYQDVTYRVWVYEVAQIVGTKHRHLLMRDVQLVIDDLSLFYDAAAQGALKKFEDVILRRAHELEIGRLPLVIHALGRSGYNTIEVARAIHNVYMKKKGHPDFYLCHLIGLLLKGYTTFHFHPGKAFLDDAWEHLKDGIKTAEFKYISWLAESFLKLRYVEHAPTVLDELLEKQHLLSHLEFTDFISGCWSIQSYILSEEFRKYVVPGTEWQLAGNGGEQSPTYETTSGTITTLYAYYKKLLRAIVDGMSSKIYNSTPPYRATQFELLTRLLVIYPNPRDFRTILPLRKFDAVYPIMQLPSEEEPHVGSVDFIFRNHTHLQASRFFGDGHNLNDALKATEESCQKYNDGNTQTVNSAESISENPLCWDVEPELKPLPNLLKQYLHSLFFRTPALAPRGIRILMQGLVRIHFEKREDCVMEPDLLPPMKTAYHSRPFSRAIIREVYRKLACYNTDDLLVTLYCMFPLRMFELDLAPTLLSQLTGMWVHQLREDALTPDQRRLIRLFYDTLKGNAADQYDRLDKHSIESIMRDIED
ncbi:hypothetical protein, conserved [Babesia bigemina]|uniref:Uncharacterized protein n=1 Tax=Babesia bigemina TaxID=5866 RepID=A0A061D8X6_BABBI|nr:hypothetical protein, conserved [Babesia bigemina]CDR95329.1 hypothetical protein, conserved [Babesia bigemina]|eukprot:XP_012767515.1 hypothetical protein, conserved [Babesia bigemina]